MCSCSAVSAGWRECVCVCADAEARSSYKLTTHKCYTHACTRSHAHTQVTRPQLPTYSPLVLSTLLYSLAALHHSLTDPPHAHHSTSPGRDALSREHQSTHPSPHTSPSRDVHNRDQPAQPTQQHSDSREQSTHPSPHTSPSRDTHSREQSSRDARTPLSRWVADAQSALLCCMPECTPRITATLWYSFGRLQLLPEPALLQVGCVMCVYVICISVVLHVFV